jgi:hypothetical protein
MRKIRVLAGCSEQAQLNAIVAHVKSGIHDIWSVYSAVWKEQKPSPGLTRHVMN